MQKQLMTAVFVMVLTPALLLAQKVSYDFDKSANFAALQDLRAQGRHEGRAGADRRSGSSRRSTRSWRRRG